MKKKILMFLLALIFVPFGVIFTACKDKDEQPAQEEMYNLIISSYGQMANYEGSMTAVADLTSKYNGETESSTTIYSYNSATGEYIEADKSASGYSESFDSFARVKDNQLEWFDDDDSYIVDKEYTRNEIMGEFSEEYVAELLGMAGVYKDKTYSENMAQLASDKQKAIDSCIENGYTNVNVERSLNFKKTGDNSYVLTSNYSNSYTDSEGNPESYAMVVTIKFGNSFVNSYGYTMKEEWVSSDGQQKQSESTAEVKYSNSFDTTTYNHYKDTVLESPTEKIKTSLYLYLDGQPYSYQYYEYGTDIDTILAGLTVNANTTLVGAEYYVDKALTTPYIAGSKVKSYDSSYIYAVSKPVENYSHVLINMATVDHWGSINYSTKSVVIPSGSEYTLDLYGSYHKFDDKIVIDGVETTNTTINLESGKTYKVFCYHNETDQYTTVNQFMYGEALEDAGGYGYLVSGLTKNIDQNDYNYWFWSAYSEDYDVVAYKDEACTQAFAKDDVISGEEMNVYYRFVTKANQNSTVVYTVTGLEDYTYVGNLWFDEEGVSEEVTILLSDNIYDYDLNDYDITINGVSLAEFGGSIGGSADILAFTIEPGVTYDIVLTPKTTA